MMVSNLTIVIKETIICDEKKQILFPDKKGQFEKNQSKLKFWEAEDITGIIRVANRATADICKQD